MLQFLRSYQQDGCKLRLIYDAAALQQVEDMVLRERECCSFLQFDLRPGETIELTIGVPADVVAHADPGELLALFYQPLAMTNDASCCGSCETKAAPARANHVAGAAVATSLAAVMACAAGCMIPLVVPAITATVAGSALAWLGREHAWMTGLAILVSSIAWWWILRQQRVHALSTAKITLGLMAIANAVALLAIFWPRIEPALIAGLGL